MPTKPLLAAPVVLALLLGAARPVCAQVCAQATVVCYCGVSVPCAGLDQAAVESSCASACASKSDPGAGGLGGASAGSGPGWQQQMQLDMAYGIGQAAGAAFVNWLNQASARGEAQRKLREEQQRRFNEEQLRLLRERERRRREAERRRIEGERGKILGEWKGDGAGEDEELAWKELDTLFMEQLAGLKSQATALDCSMGQVYKEVERLGAEGKAFAADLRKQVLDAERRLPTTLPSGAPNACDIVAFSRDAMAQEGKRSMNMSVEARVTRLNDSGQIQVDVMYTLSDGNRTLKEAQDSAILSASGAVDCQQMGAAAGLCMAQLHPGTSDGVYCPRPSPDRSRERNYPACSSGGARPRAAASIEASASDEAASGSTRGSPPAPAAKTAATPLDDIHKHFEETAKTFDAQRDHNEHLTRSLADRERDLNAERDSARRAELKKTLDWCKLNFPTSSAAAWVRRRWDARCATGGAAPEPAREEQKIDGLPLK